MKQILIKLKGSQTEIKKEVMEVGGVSLERRNSVRRSNGAESDQDIFYKSMEILKDTFWT